MLLQPINVMLIFSGVSNKLNSQAGIKFHLAIQFGNKPFKIYAMRLNNFMLG